MSQTLHDLISSMVAFYQAHETLILSIGGVAMGAMIHTMPKKIPSNAQELWTWMRDGMQTALPARRNDPTPNPILPAPREATQGVWQPTPVITNGTFSTPTQPATPAITKD